MRGDESPVIFKMDVLPHHLGKAGVCSDALARQLARYPRRLRKRVRKAALSHPYMADLAFAYPMALFAIASNALGSEVTRRARACVEAGQPLRLVSAQLELAFWLRKLPPEALVEPVPRALSSDALMRHLINFMPREARHAGRWLAAIDVACELHSSVFAIWLAKRLRGLQPPAQTGSVALLSAFAWHCARDDSPASRWIGKPWKPDMNFSDAATAGNSWLTRLEFACMAPPPVVPARPPRDNAVGPYRFTRLDWGVELLREGEAMNNCLETYAYDLRNGTQVWSIRDGDTRIADLEVSFRDGGRGVPELVQLMAKSNTPAPDAVWRAAYRWLARWKLTPTPVSVKEHASDVHPARWADLWWPFWQAKGAGRVFPIDASAIGPHWLSTQASSLWELTRLEKLSA